MTRISPQQARILSAFRFDPHLMWIETISREAGDSELQYPEFDPWRNDEERKVIGRSRNRKRDKSYRKLLSRLRKLERRGLVQRTEQRSRWTSVRWSITKLGEAELKHYIVSTAENPELAATEYCRICRLPEEKIPSMIPHMKDMDDHARRLLGIAKRDLLPVGEPGRFVCILDRVDDVVPALVYDEIEPWSHTREWYDLHYWVSGYWQFEKEGLPRGEFRISREGSREYTLLERDAFGNPATRAAERVFRLTGCRRVAIYESLSDCEHVGVPA